MNPLQSATEESVVKEENRVEVSIWKGRIQVRLFYYRWRDFFVPALRWADMDDVIEYIRELYVESPPDNKRVEKGFKKYEGLIRKRVEEAVEDYYGPVIFDEKYFDKC
ncbi:hypothetical protein AKJ52_00495 [candidate division MSBL1 archaeon SCGC-AAA382C18]|uniref:Uncharacterized protein n=1 Tax=candidate division MSBL1 archaeon SCGC-AAA382C18 TaxID=1698281 RepID=A0A133VLM9_9EURY|nr:hypothetical protein AKJ52_00495 [candidate division MSBL1 archaeon SCGC-AAA382C18]